MKHPSGIPDALKSSAKRGKDIRDMIKILFVCHGRSWRFDESPLIYAGF